MTILSYISLSILALMLTGCILSLIIIAGMKWITPFQYLYLRIFAPKEDWSSYVEMNKYIDSGHFIPVLGLNDFVDMQCDPDMKEKYSEFVSHNPYYFLIFNKDGEPELCGYRTNNNRYMPGSIIFSSFFQKLCLKMVRKMGYTYADLYSILEGDIAREEDRRMKIAELESSLKESLNEKQNNTTI